MMECKSMNTPMEEYLEKLSNPTLDSNSVDLMMCEYGEAK